MGVHRQAWSICSLVFLFCPWGCHGWQWTYLSVLDRQEGYPSYLLSCSNRSEGFAHLLSCSDFDAIVVASRLLWVSLDRYKRFDHLLSCSDFNAIMTDHGLLGGVLWRICLPALLFWLFVMGDHGLLWVSLDRAWRICSPALLFWLWCHHGWPPTPRDVLW